MGGFLRLTLAAALVVCAGCGGGDEPAPVDGPVRVTLKISSFTREVSVGLSVTGQPGPTPTSLRVSPPWSQTFETKRGAEVFLGVGNAIGACEILVDGRSVVKQHSTLSGEGATCEYTVR